VVLAPVVRGAELLVPLEWGTGPAPIGLLPPLRGDPTGTGDQGAMPESP
jgi:hypothetical protein